MTNTDLFLRRFVSRSPFGTTDAAIAAFESSEAVLLPEDIRDYFRAHNGFDAPDLRLNLCSLDSSAEWTHKDR